MRLYLAPIRGITDCIFRTIFANHFRGFDGAVAPFIATVKGKTVKLSHVRDILPEHNRSLSIIPQIIGNNPQEFIALSQKMFDLGYSKINWNLGCPFPQVTKKKRGSGLLPHPERIQSFLDQVLPRIPNKLSIKTRLGLVSGNEIQKLSPIFNAFPLTEVIVHPRTASQMYTGEADREAFDRFAKASIHPVIYNGDIINKESFLTLQLRFPKMKQWMIGRGVIANPLLAEILRGEKPDASEGYPRIKQFHDDVLDAYIDAIKNGGNVVDKMKGIWFYLARSFPNGAVSLKQIQKVKHLNNYKDIVEKIFNFH